MHYQQLSPSRQTDRTADRRRSGQQTALDLTRALRRYNRMRPENAYTALAREWPTQIVALVSDIMWGEVKGRTVKEITAEIRALMRKARRAHAAVEKMTRQPSKSQ